MRKKLSNSEIKLSNKAKIAKFIYKQNETSKQEIAQVLGFSMPTVLQNVKELIEDEIVCEVGKYQSTGGRKAKVLSIVENIKFIIGIDITKKHISIVLIDIRGIIIHEEKIRNSYEDSMEYYKILGNCLESFIEKKCIERNKILGVGISIPGIIDENNLILIRSHILNVSNVSLIKFSQFINFDTYYKNDASSAAYAEIFFDNKESIYLSLSNTVGGAIYIDNSIYNGDNFKSAEFGHMIIEPKGRECYCKKQGCIDAYCSAKVLTKHSNDDLDLFFKELKKGNEKYLIIWDEYLEYLSMAITNLRMVFDCDIILGGYVGGYLEDYILELDKKISKYNNFENISTYIRIGKHKKEASAIGVGLYFVDKFFNSII